MLINSNIINNIHRHILHGHLAYNCLKKAKINEIVETDDQNDKEEESDSEKDTQESETSESDEINIINAQINNIDLIYDVLDANSNLPQVGTSETSLKKIQDAKLYRTKLAKGRGYTAGRSSISIFMVENQEEKVNLDTGAYCPCVGKSYLKTIVPNWEEKRIPIQRVKFSSASESMKTLRIIDLILILPHPSQCIRLKVELHEVDIIRNVEKPYPPPLRRPAYPDTPRAREALDVHIKESIDHGVLRKVGHNEQVEVTTPVIIKWQMENQGW
ncbi:hypothetical protein O181_005568 [Austropuccinia psidii MF-1]|uniref:Uncharacterized protein n=1 Tax=Austropuccinia psidii MF-1 TaxID=1389203 RepID=A0A9Q3BIS2_9BASI|nr:hypothetical protein [Austropuccinia psidii MF-1]